MSRSRPWRKSARYGRTPCNVYVNGILVERSVYADERRGIVLSVRYPFSIDKFKYRTRLMCIKGKVEVVLKTEEAE